MKLEHRKHETAIHLYVSGVELGALPPTLHSDPFLSCLSAHDVAKNASERLRNQYSVEPFSPANRE